MSCGVFSSLGYGTSLGYFLWWGIGDNAYDTWTHRLVFVLEIPHHQHVKPPPLSTPWLVFVLENPHHQHVKPPPPTPRRHAFVLEIPHHQHAKPSPPATNRLTFVLQNPHHQHVKPPPPAPRRHAFMPYRLGLAPWSYRVIDLCALDLQRNVA